MKIFYSALTNIGMVRKNNQDSILADTEHNLFLVADGMGGHKGGDVASSMTIDIFKNYLIQNLDSDAKIATILKEGTLKANQAIFEKSAENVDLRGMGSTLVSIFFKDGIAYLTNVGDSRAYLVSGQEIFQLSRDHSLIQEKLNLKIYTRENAAFDPMKNVLTRSIGFEGVFLGGDVFTYKVLKNDIFILCSDGLHGKVNEADMLSLINRNIYNFASLQQKDLDMATTDLVNLANKNGGEDNISVIVIAVT